METRGMHFASFLGAVLSLASPAIAQNNSPALPTSNFRVAQPASAPMKMQVAVAGPKNFNSYLMASSLRSKIKDVLPRTRGPQAVLVYKNAAPSVVLVRSKKGVGSGSVLTDNFILTNSHVVGEDRKVVVVFYPSDPNGLPRTDEVVLADVIKLDRQRDLALLRPRSVPRRPIVPLEISRLDKIEIGTDVFAIGHPHEQSWTITSGIVSQVRPDYSFGPKDEQRRATVIQTQAAINGGNSGGPLLTDDWKIVGVNTFGKKGAQNVNFAVAAKEVWFFLGDTSSNLPTAPVCDELKRLSEVEDETSKAVVQKFSSECDDRADVVIYKPLNAFAAFYAHFYQEPNGKVWGYALGEGRTGKWKVSYWDDELDGTFPQRGLHPQGDLFPTDRVARCPPGYRATQFNPANIKSTKLAGCNQ